MKAAPLWQFTQFKFNGSSWRKFSLCWTIWVSVKLPLPSFLSTFFSIQKYQHNQKELSRKVFLLKVSVFKNYEVKHKI